MCRRWVWRTISKHASLKLHVEPMQPSWELEIAKRNDWKLTEPHNSISLYVLAVATHVHAPIALFPVPATSSPSHALYMAAAGALL